MLGQLEALAVAACVHVARGRRPSRDDLDQLLASPLLCDGPIAMHDDPYEHHFTELFDFDGGPYLTFPGATTGGTSVLSSLVGGLRLGTTDLPARFVQDAFALIRSVLKLSHELIERVGLPRLSSPAGSHWLSDGTVHPSLPDPATLTQLRRAVTFSRLQLATLLGITGARELMLNLGVRAAHINPEVPAGHGNLLLLRPLVVVGDMVIVACPHTLLAATVRWVLRKSQEQGLSETLTSFLQEANVHRAELALHRVDAAPLDIPLGLGLLPGSSQSLHLLDAEVLLHLIVLTEPIQKVDTQQYVGLWELDLPNLHPHLPADLPPHEVLTLLVVQSQGDAFRFSLPPQRPQDLLILELDDLETFASAYPQEALALYRLHRSQLALWNQMEVWHSAPIDLMAYCCEAAFIRSFPLVPEAPLLLGTAPSSEWRRGIKASRDRHLVPWTDQQTLVPIERAWDAPPGVYTPVSVPWSRSAMAARHDHQTVWILDGTGQSLLQLDGLEPEAPPSDHVDQVVQALVIWLTRLLPLLPPLQRPVVSLIVHPIQEQSPHFQLLANRKHGIAHLALGQDFAVQLARPDNRAERELLAATSHLLFELATGKQPEAGWVRAVVDQLAPLGDGRLIFSIQPGLNAELDPRNLTRPRLVQISEWHAKQVMVGRTLAAEQNWVPGVLAGLDRRVMERANELLFTELRQTIATCEGRELLNALLPLYEAVRHDIAWLSYTGVSRQLTHGPSARQISGRHHSTSTALRFLIELVVAEPPSGQRPPSLLLMDDLIATAVAIIEYGMVGDALQHGLGTVEATYGLDGAFRVQAREYAEAATTQATSFLARSMQTENALRYRDPEQAAAESSVDPRLETIDRAFQGLYGLTFRDLMGFLNAVQNLADEQHSQVTRMPLRDFLSSMQARSGWSQIKVELALEPLIMKPRQDFLDPPKPYRKSDVFPWQFNRELSLARRPLLVVPGASGDDIVWANRVVEGAKHYWAYSLVGDGRLDIPPSKEPDRKEAGRALKSLRELSAATFNRSVAELARSCGCKVLENVGKINGKRMMTADGDDLGDVDVLAIDRELRRIWLVECKDYTVARTPVELATDIEVLIRGKVRPKGGRERPLLERHQRRADYVRRHLNGLLQMVGETETHGWTITPLIVMSSEPFALMQGMTELPLCSAEQFKQLITRE